MICEFFQNFKIIKSILIFIINNSIAYFSVFGLDNFLGVGRVSFGVSLLLTRDCNYACQTLNYFYITAGAEEAPEP